MSKKRKIAIGVIVGIILVVIYGYVLYQAGYDKGELVGHEKGIGKLRAPKDGQIYRTIMLGYSESENRCYELPGWIEGSGEEKYYLCRRPKWSGKAEFIQVEPRKK